MAVVTDYRDLGAIIPSILDDFGLTASQFRIYGRIARRAGHGGVCNESAKNMASKCRMNVKTVRESIHFLADHKLIEIQHRTGKPPEIVLTHASKWIPVGDPKTGIPKIDPTQNEITTLPKMRSGGDPKTGRGCTQNRITKESHKGIPLKNPIKDGLEESENDQSFSCVKKTNPEERKSSAAEIRQSVPLTANQKAKMLIEEVCPWGDFFEKRKSYLEGTEYYKSKNIRVVEGTVLKPYREKLEKAETPWSSTEDKQKAIASAKELICTHIEELGLDRRSATQQSREDTEASLLDDCLEQYKTDPSIAALSGREFKKRFGIPQEKLLLEIA